MGASLAQTDGLLLINSAASVPVLRQGNMIDLAGVLDRDETFLNVTCDLFGLPLASIAETPTAWQVK